MDGACSMHVRGEKVIQNSRRKNMMGRDNLGDLGTDGRIILDWILEK